MKKKSKIRNLILLIVVITGFTCIFSTGVQGKPTKLIFEGEATQIEFQIQDQWMEDGVYHIRYYRKSNTSGTIEGIESIGYNEVYGHIKIEATGDYTINGIITSHITWNGRKGNFYGHYSVKGFMYIIPSWGDYNGKSTMQGAGDYNGWKSFSISWSVEEGRSGFSGTILIPKYEF